MAFKSFDELISMASENPKQAHNLVARAQRRKTPVVSEYNSGYNRVSALKRRLKKNTATEDVINDRKEIGY